MLILFFLQKSKGLWLIAGGCNASTAKQSGCGKEQGGPGPFITWRADVYLQGRIAWQGVWQEHRGSEDAGLGIVGLSRESPTAAFRPAASLQLTQKAGELGPLPQQSQAAAGLTIAAFTAAVLPQRHREGPSRAGTVPVPKQDQAGHRELQGTTAMAGSCSDCSQPEPVPHARPVAA